MRASIRLRPASAAPIAFLLALAAEPAVRAADRLPSAEVYMAVLPQNNEYLLPPRAAESSP